MIKRVKLAKRGILEMSEEFKYPLPVVSIRLVKEAPLMSKIPITSPEDAVTLMGEYLSDFDREVLSVLNLRTDGTPISCAFVSMGGLNYSFAHPREMLKAAILSNAEKLIIVHNHPSGTLTPSKDDVKITDNMQQLCELIQIPLVDHVIVGGNNSSYFSFAEHRLIKTKNQQFETDYHKLQFPKDSENRNVENKVSEQKNVSVIPRRRTR